MKFRRVLFLLILPLALSGAGPATGAEQVSPESEPATDKPTFTRSDAYRLLRRGDELRERREWAEAAHFYRSALEKYRVLAGRAPAWEQDYYRFRIGYCERELAMIVRATGRSVDEWLAERAGDVSVQAEDYRALYHSVQEENRYLRNRVDELLQELEMYREMDAIEQEREEQRAAQTVRDEPELREEPETPPARRGQPTPLPEQPIEPPVPPEPRLDNRQGLNRPVPLR